MDAEFRAMLLAKRREIVVDELRAYEAMHEKFWQVWQEAEGRQLSVREARQFGRWYFELSELGRRAVGMPVSVTGQLVGVVSDVHVTVDDMAGLFRQVQEYKRLVGDTEDVSKE